jgi:hypothetical protein
METNGKIIFRRMEEGEIRELWDGKTVERHSRVSREQKQEELNKNLGMRYSKG